VGEACWYSIVEERRSGRLVYLRHFRQSHFHLRQLDTEINLSQR